MEKLQNAIEKARQKRGATISADQATEKKAQSGPARTDTGSPWTSLAPLTLDPAVLKRNRIVTMEAGQAATAFDILRTKILLQMRENGWTRLAITSPQPTCGKTTIACNLGIGMTRQPDLKAILFDLDLRRPGIAHALGHTPAHSIREMMENKVDFDSQGVRVGDNLAISMARTPMADPTSLLLDKATTRKLDEIEAAYTPDLMIFDLPPLLTGDDTRAFLKNADCALLVLRAEESKSSQIDTSEKEIAKYTNVLGMVLNSCRHGDEDQGYGYY
jgi:protein-tyrosine kinase